MYGSSKEEKNMFYSFWNRKSSQKLKVHLASAKKIIFLRLEKFFERESCFTTNKQVFVGSLTFWGNGE